jgi:hypothetical protein
LFSIRFSIDVVDVDDQLLQLREALVHVRQVHVDALAFQLEVVGLNWFLQNIIFSSVI